MKGFSRRRFVTASGALAAVPALSTITAKAQPPAPDIGDLRAERDIVFGKGGDIDLLLDVYHPPETVEPKRMSIVHYFGGGFSGGSKTSGYVVNDIKALGARGYTNISANYRLRTQGLWPAQIHDAKAAIRWTRANADRLGVDADKIAVAGYSAGGMLSLLAAGTNGMAGFEGDGGNNDVSSDVQAAIAVYPLTRLKLDKATPMFPREWSEEAVIEAGRAASPTSYISQNHAPTIFIHGTADRTEVPATTIDYFNHLLELGVPTALTMIQGADHAFDNTAFDAIEVMNGSHWTGYLASREAWYALLAQGFRSTDHPAA